VKEEDFRVGNGKRKYCKTEATQKVEKEGVANKRSKESRAGQQKNRGFYETGRATPLLIEEGGEKEDKSDILSPGGGKG